MYVINRIMVNEILGNRVKVLLIIRINIKIDIN